jgi:phage protein D
LAGTKPFASRALHRITNITTKSIDKRYIISQSTLRKQQQAAASSSKQQQAAASSSKQQQAAASSSKQQQAAAAASSSKQKQKQAAAASMQRSSNSCSAAQRATKNDAHLVQQLEISVSRGLHSDLQMHISKQRTHADESSPEIAEIAREYHRRQRAAASLS